MGIAIRFARFDRARISVHPLGFGSTPSGLLHVARRARPEGENRAPRMLTPLQVPFRTLEELHDRDDPISDVLVALQARLASSKPTRRCRCATLR